MGTPCVHVFVPGEEGAHRGGEDEDGVQERHRRVFREGGGGRGGVGGGRSSRASLESTGSKTVPDRNRRRDEHSCVDLLVDRRRGGTADADVDAASLLNCSSAIAAGVTPRRPPSSPSSLLSRDMGPCLSTQNPSTEAPAPPSYAAKAGSGAPAPSPLTDRSNARDARAGDRSRPAPPSPTRGDVLVCGGVVLPGPGDAVPRDDARPAVPPRRAVRVRAPAHEPDAPSGRAQLRDQDAGRVRVHDHVQRDRRRHRRRVADAGRRRSRDHGRRPGGREGERRRGDRSRGDPDEEGRRQDPHAPQVRHRGRDDARQWVVQLDAAGGAGEPGEHRRHEGRPRAGRGVRGGVRADVEPVRARRG